MPSLPSRGIISLFPFVSLCCVHLSEALPRLSPFLSPCFALSDAVSAFARPPLSPLLFPLDAVSFPRPCLSLFFLLLCWMLRPPFRGLVTLLVSLMFSLLLDAVSAFQRPCLPCLPSCSPMLDAVSALPRPSHLSCFRSCFLLLPFPALCCILCLPCQGLVSLPFLSPFVGSCVASSSRGVVSLLSLLVPLLFSLCWMLCRRLCLPSFPFLVHVSVFPMPCLLSCLPSRLRSCLAFGFPLLDAVSVLRGPCLPSCFPLWHAASAPCLPRPPVLYCFPWLDAVAALWRPCLPCLPSCVLCVGCCVRLSEALSPLFVFLFPQYWKPCICLSEVLSLFLFPVLFPRCWMPCRDPKALSSLYRLLFATAGSCWVSIPRSKGWYRVPPSSHYSFREPWTLAPQCLPLCLPLAFPIYNLGNLSARFVSQLVFTVCCAVSYACQFLQPCLPLCLPAWLTVRRFFQCVSPSLPTVSPSLSASVCPIWELFPTFPPACFPACLPRCAVCVSHLEPWNFACRFVFHLVPHLSPSLSFTVSHSLLGTLSAALSPTLSALGLATFPVSHLVSSWLFLSLFPTVSPRWNLVYYWVFHCVSRCVSRVSHLNLVCRRVTPGTVRTLSLQSVLSPTVSPPASLPVVSPCVLHGGFQIVSRCLSIICLFLLIVSQFVPLVSHFCLPACLLLLCLPLFRYVTHRVFQSVSCFVSHFVSAWSQALSLTMSSSLSPILSPRLSPTLSPAVPAACPFSLSVVCQLCLNCRPLCLPLVSGFVSRFVPPVSPTLSPFISHLVPRIVSHFVSRFVTHSVFRFCLSPALFSTWWPLRL